MLGLNPSARLKGRKVVSWCVVWHRPQPPADVMIVLPLLHNHHCKDHLNTTEPGSIFEHYKNPTERQGKERTLWVISTTLSLSLFLSLRVSIHSKNLTWASEGVSGHLYVGKHKAQILVSEWELSLPCLREEFILSWPGINKHNL